MGTFEYKRIKPVLIVGSVVKVDGVLGTIIQTEGLMDYPKEKNQEYVVVRLHKAVHGCTIVEVRKDMFDHMSAKTTKNKTTTQVKLPKNTRPNFPENVSHEALIDALLVIESFCIANALKSQEKTIGELHAMIWDCL